MSRKTKTTDAPATNGTALAVPDPKLVAKLEAYDAKTDEMGQRLAKLKDDDDALGDDVDDVEGEYEEVEA